MKKLRYLSLMMLASVISVFADSSTPQALKGGDATGQTFFWARPQFQDAMPEKVSLFRNDRALARDCGWGGAFQAVIFGGRTTNKDSQRLARYFMFEEKDQLTVASTGVADVDTTQGVNVDINPLNFNVGYAIDGVPATYQSTLIFKPRQSVVGAGFDYIQYFGCGDCPRWWGEVSFPVLRVRNDMRLTETNIVIEAGATLIPGAAPSIAAAFTGQFPISGEAEDVWQFGIINGKQQKTGVADVEIKVGYEYIRNDCSYLYSYLGVLVPTGTKPQAKYVFEPILGENRHVGFLSGGSGGYEIWEGCGKNLWFDCDIAWRYLFNKSQLRSFDLYNRPWSRYMPIFVNETDAAIPEVTPGINTFTQKMKINPGLQFDINWAFVFSTECGFLAEVGYNFWARTAERVKLATPWVVGPAIANLSTGAPVANEINRISNIGAFFGPALNITAVNPVTPNTLYLIQEGDINFNSAACPAALTQTIYGTLGYSSDCWCWPILFAVGGSYEWSKINTALTRWTAWGKIGISL